MQKQEPISNQTQIFRHDARGCFVEAKCDRFHLDRVHLQFVAYDKNRPQGQRYTNNVNIYILSARGSLCKYCGSLSRMPA